MIDEQKERENFEKWCGHPAACQRYAPSSVLAGRYIREEVQGHWEAWLARAEIAERDRLDAERYRWLRERGFRMAPDVGGPYAKRDELDRDIDAAMKENGNE